MKILIGYDGSDCANAALSDLDRAGLPPDTQAHVLSIAEVWLPADDADRVDDARRLPRSVHRARERARHEVARVADEAESAARKLRAAHPTWSITSEAIAQSPAWGLLSKASEWSANLIVVGSHGKSALGRFIIGSISQKVLTESSCSVRIARGRDLPADYPIRIVVAFDGSDDAERAIDGLLGRSWPSGTTATLLSVVDPVIASARPPLAESAEWGTEASNAEHAWLSIAHKREGQRLEAAGLAVASRVAQGDPRKVIPAIAEELDADTIFLGARGLNSVERFLLGSVSAAIAARAHCTVEVAR